MPSLSLQKEVTEKSPIHKRFLEEVQNAIRTKLVENGIPAELEARVKGIYIAASQDCSAGAHARADLRFAGGPRNHGHGA